jgi:hypothetical protein
MKFKTQKSRQKRISQLFLSLSTQHIKIVGAHGTQHRKKVELELKKKIHEQPNQLNVTQLDKKIN